jgi:hypothetical protein
VLSWEFNKLWWDVINQPYSIGRASENEACPVHVTRSNRQQRWFAVATADLNCDLGLRRQVDIVPFHFLQTVLPDAVEKSDGCAVIQKFWRHLRWVLEIHLDGMALARTDALAVVAEREALLVAGGNDVFELV